MNIALLSSAAACIIFSLAFLVVIFFAFYFYISLKKNQREIAKEREESTRRLYELVILKELGERVEYSLDVEEILRIITGSLRQFIDYTAVGYIVLSPDKVELNVHLEQSASSSFLNEMKTKMIASVSALAGKDLGVSSLHETVSGASITNKNEQKIGSLFNIPLSIDGQVAGVLTVAHLKEGLYKEEDMTILYKITARASEAVSRLQEVVKKEKGKLNAMVESMVDGVLMVDPEFKVVVANPAAKKIIKLNWKSGGREAGMKDFAKILGEKFDIRSKIEEAAVKKSSCVSERINIDDSFFEIGVCPVLHSTPRGESEVLGVVVVFHDITKDIELERVREEFTSMIVHELRSPLDGIKKMAELIVSGAVKASTDQFREYLGMVHQSSSSMLELVNDILDLSKLQAGKFEVVKEEANVKDLVENRIVFYKVSADAKKVSLGSFLASNLPATCKLDQQAIKQVLNNLLSNALKFTSQGGKVSVSAFSLQKGESFPADLDTEGFSALPEPSQIKIKAPSLCIMVSDTGIGIPEKNISELFHTYKQVRLGGSTDGSKGTGLGLVIAKGIVEAHGGIIGAVSKEGLGSSFYFTIPL